MGCPKQRCADINDCPLKSSARSKSVIVTAVNEMVFETTVSQITKTVVTVKQPWRVGTHSIGDLGLLDFVNSHGKSGVYAMSCLPFRPIAHCLSFSPFFAGTLIPPH